MIEPQNTLVPLAEPAPVDLPKGDEGFGEMLAQTLGMVPQLESDAIRAVAEEATQGDSEDPDQVVGSDQGGGRRRPHIPTPPLILAPGDGTVPAPRPVTGPVVAAAPDLPSEVAGVAEPVVAAENPAPATAPAPMPGVAPTTAPSPDTSPLTSTDPAAVPGGGTVLPVAEPTVSEQIPIIQPDAAPDTKPVSEGTARRRTVPPGRGTAPTIPLEKEPVASVPGPPQPSPDRTAPVAAEATPVVPVAEQLQEPTKRVAPDSNANLPEGGTLAAAVPTEGARRGGPAAAPQAPPPSPTAEPAVKLADSEVQLPRSVPVSVPEGRVAVEPASGSAVGGIPVTVGDPAPVADSAVTHVGTPAAPAQHSALAERVLQAVELQANQPPPRTMVVDIPEIEGLRLVVSVRAGAEVHVVPATASTATDGVQQFFDELQGVLENRGFVMTGDGRRRGSNPHQEETPEAQQAPRPTFRRPQPTDNDLRI